MATRERFITIREKAGVIERVDKLAGEKGISRSDCYRQAARLWLRAEADSELERYKRFK